MSSIGCTTDSGLWGIDWLILTRNAGRWLVGYRSRWQVSNFPDRVRGHRGGLTDRPCYGCRGRTCPRSLIWLPGWTYPEPSYGNVLEGTSVQHLHTQIIWDKARRPFFWWSILIPLTKQQYVLLCSHWIRNGNQTSSVFNNWLVSWCNINVLTSTCYTWTLYHTLVQINGICVHLSLEAFVLTPYINSMSTYAGVYL